MKKIFLFVSCSFFLLTNGKSQILSNPSFEGPIEASTVPPSWFSCNEYSTPDTQPGFWNVNTSASHGNTYISLVTRGASGESNDNRIEAIGAALNNMQNNSCYNFSIDLAYSDSFSWSVLRYNKPTILNIWVGNNPCDKDKLIFSSPEIAHTDWRTYNFNLSGSYGYIIIEPNYVGSDNYYGNILIDNIQILENKLNIGNDTLLCEGDLKSLKVDGFWKNVLWSNGSRDNEIKATEGLTWVEVQDGGCVLRDSINIAYKKAIEVDFGKDMSLCEIDEIVLDASVPNAIYQWNTGSSSPLLITSTTGFYRVEISNGCETKIEEINLLPKENCCDITVPNVFTPNKDGINDYFDVKSTSNIASYEMQIFNRWGTIVFTSKSINNSWDGKQLNNLSVANSEYYWNISINCKAGKNSYFNSYRGTVMVLR